MSLARALFPAGMRKRWWAFRPVDLLARLAPKGKGGGLLVVRMDGIGDILLFRPFLDLYPEVFQVEKKDITILASRDWAGLVEPFFSDYRVVHMATGGHIDREFERSAWFRLKTSVWLRRAGYDAAVCDNFFRKTLMHDSLVLATGAKARYVSAPYRVEKTRREFGWYLDRMTHVVETGPDPTYEVERHHRFLEAVAGRSLPRPKMALKWRDVPSVVPAGAPYAVINFASNSAGRNWPLERFLALAKRVLATGRRVVFVGAAKEGWATAEIGRGLPKEGVVNLIGATSLVQLMDVLKQAALVLTNETGPGHLSVLLGAPTVMVHGGGALGTFVPYPPDFCPPSARFVGVEMDCAPCAWHCDKRVRGSDPFPCVEAVSEEKVWVAAQDLLGGVESPSTIFPG